MEGLHHDTILEDGKDTPPKDPIPPLAEEKPDVAEDKLETEELIDGNRDFSSSSMNATLSPEDKIELFNQMVRIRRFEERSLRAYQQGHIGGFLHLYIGQEAVAVGAVSVMAEHDHVITAYRDH